MRTYFILMSHDYIPCIWHARSALEFLYKRKKFITDKSNEHSVIMKMERNVDRNENYRRQLQKVFGQLWNVCISYIYFCKPVAARSTRCSSHVLPWSLLETGFYCPCFLPGVVAGVVVFLLEQTVQVTHGTVCNHKASVVQICNLWYHIRRSWDIIRLDI